MKRKRNVSDNFNHLFSRQMKYFIIILCNDDWQCEHDIQVIKDAKEIMLLLYNMCRLK